MWLFSARKTRRSDKNIAKRDSFRPRLEALEDRTLMSAGALDPTFGAGGLVTGGPIHYDQAAIAQPDGKIVVGGEYYTPGTTYANWGLARYSANGTLDHTFGTNGVASTTGIGPIVYSLALQGDGMILAGGIGTLARYNSNGKLDTTFGSGKKPTGLVSLGSNVYASGIAIQGDGKILVATGGSLLRYNSNGTPDTTFGSSHNGVVVAQVSSGNVTLQADGKILQTGSIGSPATIAVARYTSAGLLDTTFGAGGVVSGLALAGATSAGGSGVVVKSNGTIVAAGYSVLGGSRVVTLVGLSATGQIDIAFGASGYVSNSEMLNAVGVRQSTSGDILVSGIAGVQGSNSTWNIGVAAYLPNGGLDPTFGTGGMTTVDFSGGQDIGGALAIQGDGNLVVVGSFYPPSGGTTGVLARIQAPNTKITSFTATPNPVTAGSLVTLSVSGILNSNPTSTISSIVFYLDAVGGTPMTVNLISNSNGTWTYSLDTAVLAPGSHTLYAEAVDNLGVFSDPLAVSLTVL